MNRRTLERLLRDVRSGEIDPAEALERLAGLPGEVTDSATIDHHRGLRCGFPEVIFGSGKTPEAVVEIAERIVDRDDPLLATRLEPRALELLQKRFPDGNASGTARLFHREGSEPLPPSAPVAVVSAGTAHAPVAEEAALTAGALGAPVERVHDVGVAGLHRILNHTRILREVAVVVVVAGMEGALPSVVGGLTDRPVIAVPTSIGYGASLGGITALLGMLNSCAAGVTVVNIDNGFGAGYSATLIARQAVGGES